MRVTDGLPVCPPTEEAVREMLAATSRDPSEVIGLIAPRWGRATVEKIAVNAVMAGCLPEYLPVVLAAVEGLVCEHSPLETVQSTTAPLAPVIIINGPIKKTLQINYGSGCLGPGWQANATIGRAIRLLLLNVGGGIPGESDMATTGHPHKYTFCFGENEEASPWEPLHVEQGFPLEQSTVTIAYGDGPHSINDHICSSAEHILTIAADTMITMGANLPQRAPILVLCPEHASRVGSDGWSKEDVKRFL